MSETIPSPNLVYKGGGVHSVSNRQNSIKTDPEQTPVIDSSKPELGKCDVPDPEVPERAARRRFSAEYKTRILAESEACSLPGELGALLRREGLFRSHLSSWRHQKKKATLRALSPKRRGRRKQQDPKDAEIKRLQRENAQLKANLTKAKTIIDVQKKLSSLFGMDQGERS